MLKALLCIYVVCHVRSQLAANFPLVLTPTTFRLNTTQNVLFFVHRKENITVEVRDASPTRFLLYKDVLTFWSAGPSLVPITLRGHTGEQRAFFIVYNSNGQKKESSVLLSSKTGHVFLQTDKPVYTPREPVRVRFMTVDHDLRPRSGVYKLQVKNPQKIIVEDADLGHHEEARANHFLDHVFEFPPAPMLGIWQAVVSRDGQLESNVSFEVKEYNLPTFSVELESPELILPSTDIVEGKVRALYVYGKPVDGTVIFTFGIKGTSGPGTTIGRSPLKLLANGSASYKFRSAEFMAHSWFPEIDQSRFTVEALVTENSTANRAKASTEYSMFASKPFRISFENSYKYFQPNQETVLEIDVKDATGRPAAGIPLSVEIDGDNFPLRSGRHVSDGDGKVVIKLTTFDTYKTMQATVKTVDPVLADSERSIEVHTMVKQETTGSNGYLIITNEGSANLTVGNILRANLMVHQSSLRPTATFVLIVSRGKIIRVISVGPDNKLEMYVDASMVPAIRVVGVSVMGQKYLASSFVAKVEQSNCGLAVSLENSASSTINPGDSCTLEIKGHVGDVVSLIGVDEAVHIIAADTRLTAKKVLTELSEQDYGCGPGDGQDSRDVLLNSGLKALDQNEVYGSNCRQRRRKRSLSIIPLKAKYVGKAKKCCILALKDSEKACLDKMKILQKYLPRDTECLEAFRTCCKDIMARPVQGMASPRDRAKAPERDSSFVHLSYDARIEEQTQVRNDFRETWLFDIVVMNNTVEKYSTSVPHSITSWSLAAMSLSTENGLCVQREPVRVTSFRPLFMQVSLPYSVVQHEQVEMLVTVFNYVPETLKIVVYMYGVADICSEAEPGQKSERKQLVLAPNSAKSVGFALVPLKVGEFEVKVVASSFKGSDIVVKKLHVVPQGTRVEDVIALQLDPTNQQKRKRRSIKTPNLSDTIDEESGLQKSTILLKPSHDASFIVPETQECIVSAIADSYGSAVKTTLTDLDQLIRQPKGCGEQTLVYMAPTLFTLKYLSAVDRLTKDQEEKGLRFLRSGVKRELMFRKSSGAFSTFTSRPPSVWLTAFVMKIFCQSMPFIKNNIDPEVISSGMNWLTGRQDYDGSWSETYPVLHRGIMGGVDGKGPLTAFVLISVRECARTKEMTFAAHEANALENAAQKAETFLISKEGSIIAKRDAFRMALVAYSLTLSPEPSLSNRMISALKQIANTDPAWNTMYWRNLFQIETTAYALLAIMNSGQRNSADLLAISNYLNAQKSFTGTFESTQDTIVALEALSEWYGLQIDKTDDMKLICNISADSNRMQRSIEFNRNNAMVMQRFKWRPINDNLEMVTHGNGLGQVSVKLAYNVLEPPEKLCRFDIKINVTEYRHRRNIDDSTYSADEEDFSSFFSQDLLTEMFSPTVPAGGGRFKRHAYLGGSKNETIVEEPQLAYLAYASRSKRSMRRFLHFSRTSRNSTGTTSAKESATLPVHLVASAPMDGRNARQAVRTGRPTLVTSAPPTATTRSVSRLSGELPSGDHMVSKLILNLRICTFYTGGKKAAGMSIIDVGIPTGYRAEKDDLDKLISDADSLVQKYEETDRSVLLYLEKIPPARPTCVQFRITRHDLVANLQAAFVKVYDYYTPDDSCSAIFSPTRITEEEAVHCDSNVCRCARENNCPQNHQLLELGEIAIKTAEQAREKLVELVCQNGNFAFVWIGKLREVNSKLNGYNRIKLEITVPLKGGEKAGDEVLLAYSDECDIALEDPRARDKSELVIFGQESALEPEAGSHRFLNGSSIVYAFNARSATSDAHSGVGKLLSWLQQRTLRSGWSCQA
ncbi:Complement C3 [Halotydeus destructor]|nr:Complement C3 [Halotydeus destructor]